MGNLSALLDGNTLKYYKIADKAVVRQVDPRELITPKRLDVIIRYMYLESIFGRSMSDSYATTLYRDFMWLCNNNFIDGDGRKNSISDYIKSFLTVANNIKDSGYDGKLGALPLCHDTIVDGAHRLAAALLFDKKVDVIDVGGDEQIYDANFLLNLGLPQSTIEDIVLKYVELDVNTYAVVLFPVGSQAVDQARSIIKRHACNIVYEKELRFPNEIFGHNFMRICYGANSWWNESLLDSFESIRYLSGTNLSTVFFISVPKGFDTRVIKEEFRKIVGANESYAPIHINDTHSETIQFAQALLNSNSLDAMSYVLNFSKPEIVLGNEFLLFREAAFNSGHQNNFCIDTGAVLSLYGLRKSNDVDYLSANGIAIDGDANFDLHNEEYRDYHFRIPELVFNPKNYFIAGGIKFLALRRVLDFKIYRAEAKDKNDVALIFNKILSNPGIQYRLTKRQLLSKRFAKVKSIAKSIIPPKLHPLFKRYYIKLKSRYID